MKRSVPLFLFFIFTCFSFQVLFSGSYGWQVKYSPENSVLERIPPPKGFGRIQTKSGSFAEWLQHLPLKEAGSKVYLYNGSLKNRQDVHEAVIDIDAGSADLQQCADAVMRLRAEYLFSRGFIDSIHFKYTSGFECGFKKWSEGFRPVVKGNSVSWAKSAVKDPSYKNFRKYLDNIFSYCGTLSLSGELKKVSSLKDMQIGDVFIFGGSPGHAVIVLDMAESKAGEKLFMIAQSYMPAQNIHILKNFNDAKLSPWYSLEQINEKLETPEWTFSRNELKRF